MWEFVDKIIYINLDHREDRRQIMQKLFQEGSIPSEKIERFSAIKHEIGAIGCTLSHISVLKLAKDHKWKNLLIMEDDVEWVDFQANYEKLEKIITETFDVCMLGGLYSENTNLRVKKTFGAHAYIVKNHYYDILLDNLQEALSKRLNVNVSLFPMQTKKQRYNDLVKSRHEYSSDIYWWKLQEKDMWIAIIPSMCIQSITYSDTTNKIAPGYMDIDVERLKGYSSTLISRFSKPIE